MTMGSSSARAAIGRWGARSSGDDKHRLPNGQHKFQSRSGKRERGEERGRRAVEAWGGEEEGGRSLPAVRTLTPPRGDFGTPWPHR
jgi:hypothetical protein